MILQTDNPIRMVRELKGAPLSIVMVLSLVTQRVSQEYLERATGYTDKPVSQALAYLREVGLADHTSSGWMLIRGRAQQLPMVMEMEENIEPQRSQSDVDEGEEDITSLTENNDGNEIASSDDRCHPPRNDESRNNSDSLLTYLNNNNINNINQVSKESNTKNRKNSDPDPVVEENLETFRELGIKINRRTLNLARMKHVTKEYILGTVRNLKQGELLGLAIIRMEQGDELTPKKKHKSGCDCQECRGRYGDWEE